MNTDFACLCFEDLTLETYNIADIKLFEILIGVLAHVIPCNVCLNGTLLILNVAEGCFTHYTLGHHTSGNRNGLAVKGVKVILYLSAIVADVVLRYFERIFTLGTQVCQFFTPDLKHLGKVDLLFGGVFTGNVFVIAHRFSPHISKNKGRSSRP